MSELDNPLLRWARLKQAAKTAEQADGDFAGSDSMSGQAVTEVPFDPASLPSIESIAADSDVIAFLRAGVPAELTRAALRKAWTSDPAIRDFIGIAENQWDFNDPNGIPGFSPLSPAENGVDVLTQISTRLERLPATLGDLTTTAAPAYSTANKRSFDGQHNSLPANQSTAPHEMPVAVATENTPAGRNSQKSRRHGSALPR